MKHIIFITFFQILFISCSFAPKKQDINITTSKPAKVYLINPKKEKIEELGQTPLKLSFNQLNELNEDGEWIYMTITSPGYVSENLVVNSRARTFLDMNIKLQSIEWWNDPSSAIPSQVVNQIGKSIQKIYQLIRQSKLNDAYMYVEKLAIQYPQAAFLHDLKGSILLLQGKKNEAISSYERSLQISSDNPETIQILKNLKKQGD